MERLMREIARRFIERNIMKQKETKKGDNMEYINTLLESPYSSANILGITKSSLIAEIPAYPPPIQFSSPQVSLRASCEKGVTADEQGTY